MFPFATGDAFLRLRTPLDETPPPKRYTSFHSSSASPPPPCVALRGRNPVARTGVRDVLDQPRGGGSGGGSGAKQGWRDFKGLGPRKLNKRGGRVTCHPLLFERTNRSIAHWLDLSRPTPRFEKQNSVNNDSDHKTKQSNRPHSHHRARTARSCRLLDRLIASTHLAASSRSSQVLLPTARQAQYSRSDAATSRFVSFDTTS